MKYYECITTIKKKNKTKHEQTKKHKYLSNSVSNKYVKKDRAVDKFKHVLTSYYNKHLKKDIFTVYVYWKVDDFNLKLSVPNVLSYGQIVHSFPINITESACGFSDRVIKGYLNHDELTIDKIEETEIVFMSDLKDMTYTHYMKQPKSMICR